MPTAAAIVAAGVGGALISGSAAKSAANSQAQAATSAADTQYKAAQLAAGLQLGMFNTIRGDLAPYRASGAAALPGLSALLGLPSGAPASSSTTNTASPSAASGGLSVSGVPNIDPTSFNAGGMLPGATSSPYAGAVPNVGDPNWDALLQARPDVMAEFNRVSATADPNSPSFNEHGLSSPQAFAQWWYQNHGVSEGQALPTWTQDALSKAYPMAGAVTGGGNAPPDSGTQLPSNGPALTGTTGGGGAGDIQGFLENLPGYQFTKQQGLQAVTNSAAAQGLGGPGGAYAKGIARFVTGLADSTYQQELDNYFRQASMGQSAANQTGAYGSSAASGAAGSLTGGAGAIASGIIGAANANAAGTVGQANALSSAFGSIPSALLTSKILGMYGPGAGAGAGGGAVQNLVMGGLTGI